MHFEVTLAGRTERIELRRRAEGWACTLGGRPVAADVVEIGPGLLSILVGGQSFELSVDRDGDHYRISTRGQELLAQVVDPRRWLRRGGALAAAGRQEVQAPMPGLVIAVLAQPGQQVDAGQGLVVVEAMKMQNEIPAPKSGQVEQVLVKAGERVEHGQTLVVVN